MLGGSAAATVLGYAAFNGQQVAHSAAEASQSGGASGWFIKPWTSYQAVASLPDRVCAR